MHSECFVSGSEAAPSWKPNKALQRSQSGSPILRIPPKPPLLLKTKGPGASLVASCLREITGLLGVRTYEIAHVEIVKGSRRGAAVRINEVDSCALHKSTPN